MALEPSPELSQLLQVVSTSERQVLSAPAQIDVFREHTRDRRMIELTVPGKGRQQQLLLDLEMPRALPLEELQERRARLGRGLGRSALELEGTNRPW